LSIALALLVVVALASPASAGNVYRWIEGETVVYTDQLPQAGVTLTPMPGQSDVPVVRAPDAPDLLIGAAPNAPPATAPRASTAPATVDEILEISGLRPQLAGIARGLGNEYRPRPGQLGERDAGLIAQVVARHFAPERLYAPIRDDFRRRTDGKRLDEMAAWFRSPLGHKITALEIAASRPDAAAKLAAFAARLPAAPPPPARLDLVQRLDWVTGTTEDTVDLALAVVGSIARAAAAAQAANRRTRGRSVERRLEEMRGQMAATIGGNAITQMLYVYAPLSDDELKQYVDFLASPAGRAYGRSSHGALLKVVREVAERTAQDALRAVPIQRWAAAPKTAEPGAPPR